MDAAEAGFIAFMGGVLAAMALQHLRVDRRHAAAMQTKAQADVAGYALRAVLAASPSERAPATTFRKVRHLRVVDGGLSETPA